MALETEKRFLCRQRREERAFKFFAVLAKITKISNVLKILWDIVGKVDKFCQSTNFFLSEECHTVL
jgi:hypothetical protein